MSDGTVRMLGVAVSGGLAGGALGVAGLYAFVLARDWLFDRIDYAWCGWQARRNARGA